GWQPRGQGFDSPWVHTSEDGPGAALTHGHLRVGVVRAARPITSGGERGDSTRPPSSVQPLRFSEPSGVERLGTFVFLPFVVDVIWWRGREHGTLHPDEGLVPACEEPTSDQRVRSPWAEARAGDDRSA